MACEAESNPALEHFAALVGRPLVADLAPVFSVRAYLTSIDLYDEFNAAYADWFTGPLPTRTCIAVAGLAVGALVEVDLLAALD